jgi:hypothetical protein
MVFGVSEYAGPSVARKVPPEPPGMQWLTRGHLKT